MKVCKKCGCIYDDSDTVCPSCHCDKIKPIIKNKRTSSNINSGTKKCLICKFDITKLKGRLCPNCGSYIKFMPRLIILPATFIIFVSCISILWAYVFI